MTNYQSTTTEKEISQITYFLRLFRPKEISFLLEINNSWSSYDTEKYEPIANIFRQTFNSSQMNHDVRAVIDFFNVHNSLSFTTDKPFLTMPDYEHDNLHLNPWTSICPLCQTALNAVNATKKRIVIYFLNGKTRIGIYK